MRQESVAVMKAPVAPPALSHWQRNEMAVYLSVPMAVKTPFPSELPIVSLPPFFSPSSLWRSRGYESFTRHNIQPPGGCRMLQWVKRCAGLFNQSWGFSMASTPDSVVGTKSWCCGGTSLLIWFLLNHSSKRPLKRAVQHLASLRPIPFSAKSH